MKMFKKKKKKERKALKAENSTRLGLLHLDLPLTPHFPNKE